MIVLRELRDADRTWLVGWLPAVAGSVDYDASTITSDAAITDGRTVHVIERDDSAVGLVVYRLNAPRAGCAIVEFVGTPAAEARRGAGMRAAALVEDELRARGVRTIFAPVAAVHGISMYFWIRLGYRPLLRGEWPCEVEGVAWLRRDVGSEKRDAGSRSADALRPSKGDRQVSTGDGGKAETHALHPRVGTDRSHPLPQIQ